MSQQASLSLAMQAAWTETLEAGARSTTPRLTFSKSWSDGGGDSQANAHVTVKETIANGVPRDLDLRSGGGGGIIDMDGLEGKVIFSSVKAMMIKNLGDVYTLMVTTTIASGWAIAMTGIAAVPPGGVWLFVHPVAGFPVDATHRYLRLTAAGGDVDVEVMIIGVEA